MSTERLKRMRIDLESEVAENIHYTGTTEAGRSESNEQEAEIHNKLYAVFTVLRLRGELTEAEVKAFFSSVPITKLRIYTKPFGRY